MASVLVGCHKFLVKRLISQALIECSWGRGAMHPNGEVDDVFTTRFIS